MEAGRLGVCEGTRQELDCLALVLCLDDLDMIALGLMDKISVLLQCPFSRLRVATGYGLSRCAEAACPWSEEDD